MERYVILQDFNTKEWQVYDNVTNRIVCTVSKESTAVQFVVELMKAENNVR